jgi:lipopolysaccharide export system protein LptA
MTRPESAMVRTLALAAVIGGSLLMGPAPTILGRENAPEASAPKTVITGGRMNLLRKGDAVEFVGGVTLVRGKDRLAAERMVSEEKRGLVKAWGDVRLRRDMPAEGVRWEAWADEGAYDTRASSGTLRGKKRAVRVKRSPLVARSTEPVVYLEAERMTFFQAKSPAAPGEASPDQAASVEAWERVYLRYDETVPEARRTEVWADRASYDGVTGELRFWNGAAAAKFPRARQEQGGQAREVSGKVISFFAREERLSVEQNVQAVVFPSEPSHGAPR